MGYCLKPNIVYMTNPKHLGSVIFQPVNGNIQLFVLTKSSASRENTNKGERE
jgi:hypothetical protein